MTPHRGNDCGPGTKKQGHCMSMPVHLASAKTRLLLGVCLAIATASASGCATKPSQMTTGSIPKFSKPIEQMDSAELNVAADQAGRAYDKAPTNPQVGITYANLLLMSGKNDQALAVMQRVAIANPKNSSVLAAYGKTQAATGQFDQALASIQRAQTPDRPDWKLFSAEGAVLDQLGRPDEARERYRNALDIVPNEPSVLSNLGMSYLLTGDLKTAESYLRTAIAQPAADSRVRQNLALVVGLQGRFDEAINIAQRELTKEQADANVAYLKQMLNQQGTWKKLAKNG